MYSVIYKLYFSISSKETKIITFFRSIVIRIINLIVPFYFKMSSPFQKKLHRNDNPNFIVSLTTFPLRINKVSLTIESILRQKIKPDKILLWLSEEEFPTKNALPKNLLSLEKRGLEIRFCRDNLKPHNKYFYTMLEFPSSNVITIDDDMMYPPDLIKKLKKFHNEYPNSIICPITRKINITNDIILPYKQWKYEKRNSKPSFLYLTMGVGGTLYPPNSLHNSAFNINLIQNKAIMTDDLWLKIMSLLNHTKVVSIAAEYPCFYIPIIYKNNKQLMDNNIEGGENDKVFKALMEYYNLPVSVFKD